MPPHALIHAAHGLKEALTGAADEGGGWAWGGAILGAVVGYLLVFTGDGPWTEEIVVLGLICVGLAALTGAYFGVLGKLTYDHVTDSERTSGS